MGNLKVEIDYGDIAHSLIAVKNAAKLLIESCNKIQVALDNAVTQTETKENEL